MSTMNSYLLTPDGPSLGGAFPLVCAPIVAHDRVEVRQQAIAMSRYTPHPDLVELRADHLREISASDIPGILAEMHEMLEGIPSLFTNRAAFEGGATGWDEAERWASIHAAITSGSVAMIDLEFATNSTARGEIISAAKATQVGVIISSHDFAGTPDDASLTIRLNELIASGADVAKLAVTAQTPHDALRLLQATERIAATSAIPLITMAMGQAGTITRLAGPFFGSSLSFASVGATSAPGQLPVTLVRDYWHAVGLREA